VTRAVTRIAAALAAFGVFHCTPTDGSNATIAGGIIIVGLVLYAARD
jgi:hypothetical protein